MKKKAKKRSAGKIKQRMQRIRTSKTGKILILLVCIAVAYSLVKIGIITYQVYDLRNNNPKITSLIRYRIEQHKEEKKKYYYDFDCTSLSKISPDLKIAILAAEDPNFFDHYGFDLRQIKESFKVNIKKGKIVRGASTITMQTARTLFLYPKRSIVRKVKESVISVIMELLLSKKRIFELYVNYLELGDGVFGVERASHYYFHKHASDLTYYESIALTGAIARPFKSNPAKPDKWLQWKIRIIDNKVKLLPKGVAKNI
ncbi:MAG: monofunctional biosynthetic peptidoglycan transglycosylase [Candidatus Fischerbacteria bacterium RBG_13_37_8]|uniref:Monofunctional biosynthetic peptidoglycan transglycosylase n=1 Tax=Candidatus Fischerbacteria bacterium RBG_13_37_8 TaxID=1817863 RepID=A0A1F5VFC0_9BACT|nr:MAG: monofunctional biosynthetic peptidoglycan transglycosylase [Candidatus Fischerbacteria bacterium RBG_13_37_8]